MPKNILFTSWYTGLGGGETDLLSIASLLDPQQWHPHLMLPTEGTLATRWRDNGWTVHIVPYRGASTFFVPAIWSQFPIVKKIENLIDAQQIDIISSEYHTIPFAYPASRKKNIPIMWTVWGWWFNPKFWQRDFFRQIPMVARSKSIRDGFVGDPPFIDPDSIPIVYSGVDTNRFKSDATSAQQERQTLGIDPDTPLIAMIARFQPVKGHHTFQDIIREVVKQIPSAQFIVAGEDTFGVSKDEAYRQQMLDNAQTDPILQKHLRYIGFRNDVENVLNAADVVVCASEFESFGKVNSEAMACETPVVSTNQGGPTETVIDGQTGYLVSPKNPQAFAEKIIKLIQDNALRRQLGKQARQHVIENFSAQEATNQYEALFLKLLK